MARKSREAAKAERLRVEKERAKDLLRDYKSASKDLGRKGRSMDIELYLGEESRRKRPVLVFNHIKKTAGTSVRVVIHANYQDLEHRTERLPRDGDRRAWFAALYEQHGGRMACVAGHHAGLMLGVVEDRPAQGFVMLREAVDRVLSRYYFMAGHNQRRGSNISWTLEGFFGKLETRPDKYNARPGMCNTQSRAILESHYDLSGLPLLAEDPDSDLWRERTFELIDRHYIVGVQSRFDDSVNLFADQFGWKHRRASTIRRNRNRPDEARQPLPPATDELIRRYNWLDDELYVRAVERFESRKRRLRLAARR